MMEIHSTHRRITIVIAACMIGICMVIAVTSQSVTASSPSTIVVDPFDGPALDSRWSWIREDPSHWSLTARPGFLRITTQQGGLFPGAYAAKNVLVQQIPAGSFEMETRVEFGPTVDYQFAGLLVYQDDTNYLDLVHSYCHPSQSCVGDQISFDQATDGHGVGSNFATPAPQQSMYLKMARHENTFDGYISTDGQTWTLIGSHTITFTPSRIGITVADGGTGAPQIPADFD